MTRNRVSKRLSSEYEFELPVIQVLQVSWLLAKENRGYNLTEGRYVSAIIEEFDLESYPEVSEKDLKKMVKASLSGYELEFLKGLIAEEFDKRSIPAVRVTPVLNLYDLIESMLSKPVDESTIEEE